jgi:hypothetical protein
MIATGRVDFADQHFDSQFKIFLVSCGLLCVASTFSLLQMGAADKETHRLNVPLFILSQLSFTASTLGFSIWHLILMVDLNCWPLLNRTVTTQAASISHVSEQRRLNGRPLARVNLWLAVIKSLGEGKLLCGIMAYLVTLVVSTLAWRLSMLKSRWAVCVFSRLANSMCLCFLILFSVMLIRAVWRLSLSSAAALFALAGNIFGMGESHGRPETFSKASLTSINSTIQLSYLFLLFM